MRGQSSIINWNRRRALNWPWLSWQGSVTWTPLTEHWASFRGIRVTVPFWFSNRQCSLSRPKPCRTAGREEKQEPSSHFTHIETEGKCKKNATIRCILCKYATQKQTEKKSEVLIHWANITHHVTNYEQSFVRSKHLTWQRKPFRLFPHNWILSPAASFTLQGLSIF